jgi:hypothetical protein
MSGQVSARLLEHTAHEIQRPNAAPLAIVVATRSELAKFCGAWASG